MWEDQACWNKTLSLLDRNGSTLSLLSPSCSSVGSSEVMDPYSPFSSTGSGSPYSTRGSMSPDTTSSSASPCLTIGSDNGDCFSPNIFFPLTNPISPGDWYPCSFTGEGKAQLPPFHEWRNGMQLYLEYHQNQPLKFVYPPVTPMIGGAYEAPPTPPLTPSKITSDTVVTSSTNTSPLNSSTNLKRPSASKLPSLLIGQRAERFLKSFKESSISSSVASPSTCKETNSEGICSISSTSVLEDGKPFDCMWIDCRASFLQKVKNKLD